MNFFQNASFERSSLLIQELLLPSQASAQQSAVKFGLEIAAFNQMQYQKTMNSVLGVDIFLEFL